MLLLPKGSVGEHSREEQEGEAQEGEEQELLRACRGQEGRQRALASGQREGVLGRKCSS